MDNKVKRASRWVYGLAMAKIGWHIHNLCPPRARVPAFLTENGEQGHHNLRKPSVYAGVQRINSPLSCHKRGRGGSSSLFAFYNRPISSKEFFNQCNL